MRRPAATPWCEITLPGIAGQAATQWNEGGLLVRNLFYINDLMVLRQKLARIGSVWEAFPPPASGCIELKHV